MNIIKIKNNYHKNNNNQKKITKKINKNSTIKYFKINLYKNNKYINKFVLNLQDGIVSDEMLNSYFCNTLFKVKRTEQVEAFGKMYKAKIKELLGVE